MATNKKTTKKAAPKAAAKKTVKAKKILNPAPEQFRKLWVKALRSGKYEQTAGGLHDEDGYCCLGVACDIYNDHFEDKIDVVKSGSGATVYAGASGLLPEQVREALGMDDNGGSFVLSKNTKKPPLKKLVAVCKKRYNNDFFTEGKNSTAANVDLVTLNDSFKMTFKEIAAVVEANPTDLFTK